MVIAAAQTGLLVSPFKTPSCLAQRDHRKMGSVGDVVSDDFLGSKRGSTYTDRQSARMGQSPISLGRRSVSESPNDITQLLRAAASGERGDQEALMKAIYDDLRRLAVSHMSSERLDHTLQPTALVHEAYLKLVGQHSTDWADRLHFFSVASRIIRRILIDHARERRAQKRGGAADRVSMDAVDVPFEDREVDLIALDDALKDLAQIDERQARIVELRFFGGCTIEEVAKLLDVGRRTIDRDWMAAKAWLYCHLTDNASEGDDD